jgi:hypothetical protein
VPIGGPTIQTATIKSTNILKNLNLMKKIFVILSAIVSLASSVTNLAIVTAGAGMITYAALDNETASIAVMSALFVAGLFAKKSPNFAYIVFTEGICEKVQDSLNRIMGANSPSLKRTQVGYLQAITSPQNTSGMEVIPIDPGDGKIKQVRIKYIQRGTEADTVTTKPNPCVTVLEKAPLEDTISVDDYVGMATMKFTESQMRRLCEPDSEYMRAVINAEVDAVVRKLNRMLITSQGLNFGNFNPNVVGAKSVQLLQASNNNAANYIGEATIMEDLENLDMNGRPIVIGSGNLGLYTRQVGIGCCNNFGQDISQAGNMDFFRDRFVGPILGNTNDFIALIPGHIQLLTFNEYVGPYAKENDVFSHGTFRDPITGLVFDSRWHYNDCEDFYTWQFGLNFDMFYLPTDSYSAYDEMVGVNGTLHYRATSA